MVIVYLLSALAFLYLAKLGIVYVVKFLRRGKITFVFAAGEVKAEELDEVRSALNRLNKPMLSEAVVIHFLEGDDPHLNKTWMGTRAGGHLCNLEQNRICLSTRDVTFRAVCHEVGHLHHARLMRKGSDFNEEWLAIQGGGYVSDPLLPVRNGVLTAYGCGNILEDVAEWVSECYVYLHTRRSPAITANPEVKKDFRYRVKLVLLHRYGFLSKKDYQTLKPLFE